MPRLTRIYTRTGDDGTTALGTGQRVNKAHPRVAAYGDVDEANAAIGLAASFAEPDCPETAGILRGIQNDLFDVGADLCIPPDGADGRSALRVTDEQVARLEALIDRFNADLEPLTNFVLPGGTPLASALHMARAVTRRAERAVTSLAESEPGGVGPAPIAYLNRLSDLLFVLARVANDRGHADILWHPAAGGRPSDTPADQTDTEP